MTTHRTTAYDFAEMIRAKLASEGVTWQPSHVDGFKIGDPGIAVKGVAVTFQPTLTVLQRSRDSGLNLVISHEASFWEGFDAPQIMPRNPLRLAKEAFVRDNGMVIWRIHDHLHRMSPDPVFAALLRRLGWPAESNGGLPTVQVPETRLDHLVRHVQNTLETANVTVVGDPKMPVRRIGFGAHVLSTVLPAAKSCDVVIVGETSEFDTFEYFRDANTLGTRKALIRVAHERFEEWGMEDFATWLRPAAGVPVEWIPTGDPFAMP